MSYKCFDVDVRDGVAQVRMVRPEKLNSMIPEFWSELPAIVDELSAGSDARVIVLSAEGRHFCAGMDLSVFAASGSTANSGGASGGGGSSVGEVNGGETDGAAGSGAFASRSRATTRETILRLQRSFSCLEESRLPVIAAIQGACVGGAVDMVSACDIRFATRNAFFTIQEINIGMTADVGTLQRMPALVGEGIARELAFTGRRMEADEAAQHGFVNAVYEDTEAMTEAVGHVAAQIAQKSPMAVWGSKQVLNYSRDHSVADGLEYIATWNAAMFDAHDMAESFKAQQDGRAAEFPDHRPSRDPFAN